MMQHIRLPSHARATILALLFLVGLSPAQAARTVIVDPTIQYQTVQGFGTDLSWWAHRVGGWSEPARSEVMKLVFDRQSGLGFTVVRYNIGGGENPQCTRGDHLSTRAKIEGFKPTESGPYDWTAAPNQRWVLEHCKEVYGVADFDANAISPPWWMTVSGCAAGADTPATPNLKEDCYDDFACYLADVIEHFRDEWGVTFGSLSPFNEPQMRWWVKGSAQEGCCYTRPLMDRMVRELGAELNSRGLPTTVCSPDNYAVATSVASYESYSRAARSHVGVISSHSYQGSLTDRYAFRDLLLSEQKAGMMSEVCQAGRPEGHTHTGMRCALEMAWQITTDMRDMGVAKWIMWTPVVDEFYNVNDVWNANDNWGPIHAYFTGPQAEQYWAAKELYGIAHYSRFIRPDDIIVEADDPRTLAAYDSSAGRLVIVTYNEGKVAVDYRYALSSVTQGEPLQAAPHRTTTAQSLERLPAIPLKAGVLSDTLPPQSITTYLIDSVGCGEIRRSRINDGVAGTSANQFDYHGEWEYARDATPTAYWTVVLDADYYKHYDAGPYSKDTHRSSTPDDAYVVRFHGTRIQLYGPKSNTHGIAAVSLDGGPETLVDCYSAETLDRVLLYSSPVLQKGPHALAVRVTGNRNPSAAAAYVSADEALVSE